MNYSRHCTSEARLVSQTDCTSFELDEAWSHIPGFIETYQSFVAACHRSQSVVIVLNSVFAHAICVIKPRDGQMCPYIKKWAHDTWIWNIPSYGFRIERYA